MDGGKDGETKCFIFFFSSRAAAFGCYKTEFMVFIIKTLVKHTRGRAHRYYSPIQLLLHTNTCTIISRIDSLIHFAYFIRCVVRTVINNNPWILETQYLPFMYTSFNPTMFYLFGITHALFCVHHSGIVQKGKKNRKILQFIRLVHPRFLIYIFTFPFAYLRHGFVCLAHNVFMNRVKLLLQCTDMCDGSQK